MNDDDQISEQLLDLFVYAPIGLALEAKELIPKLADRGRGQVALTRLAGKVAGQQRARSGRTVLEQLIQVVGATIGDPTASRSAAGGEPDHGDGDQLPIRDYDSLTAAQIVPKLAELSEDELDTVLAHEEAHRARVTVVNRIHQLRA